MLIVLWSNYERGSNSPEQFLNKSINPIDQVVNANSSKKSNFYNMTNELPEQDINDADKNTEHENVCPLSLKL